MSGALKWWNWKDAKRLEQGVVEGASSSGRFSPLTNRVPLYLPRFCITSLQTFLIFEPGQCSRAIRILADACCGKPAVAAISQAGEPASSHTDSDRGDGEDCDCICHQTFVNEQPGLPLERVLLTVLSLLLERADHPPESLPLGIDYPPQLV